MERRIAELNAELIKTKAKAFDLREQLDEHVKLLQSLCEVAQVEDTNALTELLHKYASLSDNRTTQNG